jgi:hypothetical protein
MTESYGLVERDTGTKFDEAQNLPPAEIPGDHNGDAFVKGGAVCETKAGVAREGEAPVFTRSS